MTATTTQATILPAGISVVICCYNSAHKLPPTLQHLAAQTVPDGLPWELVLVNNASTDHTADVARQHWAQLGSPAPLHIVDEPRPGTDHARRTGVFAARYSIILFCDDDNWLAPDYLLTGWQFLDSHPEVGLVGGQAEAVADEPLPDWFYNMSPYYAACAPAPHTKDLSHFGIWSAGMLGRTQAIRRSLPAHLPLLNAGRVGSNTGFGEDGEICMRVALQGLQVWYLDTLRMRHWMEPRRLTAAYRDDMLRGVAAPADVMAVYYRAQHWQQLSGAVRWLYGLLHAAKWWWYQLRRQPGLQLFSSDYLYFFTGQKRWQTSHNQRVQAYVQYLRSVH